MKSIKFRGDILNTDLARGAKKDKTQNLTLLCKKWHLRFHFVYKNSIKILYMNEFKKMIFFNSQNSLFDDESKYRYDCYELMNVDPSMMQCSVQIVNAFSVSKFRFLGAIKLNENTASKMLKKPNY